MIGYRMDEQSREFYEVVSLFLLFVVVVLEILFYFSQNFILLCLDRLVEVLFVLLATE